jgi:hypothetical protein
MRPAHASAIVFLLALVAPRLAFAQGGGAPVSVALRAGAAGSSDGQRAVFAWVELSVPFDRVARRSAAYGLSEDSGAAPAPEGPEPTAEQSAPPNGATPAEPREPAAPAPVAPSDAAAEGGPAAQRRSAGSQQRLTPSLARRTVTRALRVARISDMRSLDSLAARARASAALPELRLRGARSIDDSVRWSPTVADPYQTTRTGGVDWLIEARLAWRFDRLVFDDAEIQVERLRDQRREAQARLIERVLEALIAWHKARLGQRDPLLGEDELMLFVLQELEASARLDVLTRGWFSAAVAPSHAGQAEAARSEGPE